VDDESLDPGIYAIEHIATGRRYIGATEQLERRWDQHQIQQLIARKSKCRALQQAWNEDGPQAFRFLVLEHVDTPEMPHSREEYWLKRRYVECGSHEFNSRIASPNPWGESPTEYVTAPEAAVLLGIPKRLQWYRLVQLVDQGYIRRSHFSNGYPAFERKSIEALLQRRREREQQSQNQQPSISADRENPSASSE
jgi:hypothetical protein